MGCSAFFWKFSSSVGGVCGVEEAVYLTYCIHWRGYNVGIYTTSSALLFLLSLPACPCLATDSLSAAPLPLTCSVLLAWVGFIQMTSYFCARHDMKVEVLRQNLERLMEYG